MRRRTVVAAAATLAGLAFLRWADLHPIALPVSEPEQAGRALVLSGPADVLLVVDDAHLPAAPACFESADWSWGWANLLEQEFGRFATASVATASVTATDAATESLAPERLAGRRVVVLTGSAAEAADAQRDALERFTAQGGVLVTERPGPRLAELAGVEVGAASAAGVLRVRLGGTDPELVAELGASAWRGDVRPLAPRVPSVRVLVGSDAGPVVTLREVGRGAVLALGLDVGRELVATQQGTPAPGGFAVQDRHPDVLTPRLQTSDLVADRSTLASEVPVADLRERLVRALFAEARPLAGWWPFPDARPGAYLATHDEEAMGDAAVWMAQAERARGERATWFLMPGPLTVEGTARLAAAGAELGLHFDPGMDGHGTRRELGLWRVRPFVRPIALTEQAVWFEERAGTAPRLNRNHMLRWDEVWDAPFRRLAAQGVQLDSSYGPDVGTRGYLFGTGLPFRALDRTGRPLPVRELPFVAAEDLGGADRAFLWRLLAASAERHHVAVVSLFHPNAFAWHPSAEVYRTWRDAPAEARRHGLWVATAGEVLAHWEQRTASPLVSRWDGRSLSVAAEPAADGLTLWLPGHFRGRPASTVHVDGAPVAPRRVPDVSGTLLLVPLARGRCVVDVDYAPAGER